MSKTCVRCGAEFHTVTMRDDTTRQLHVGNWNQDNESWYCTSLQRDQLASNVEAWKAYAGRLKQAGDAMHHYCDAASRLAWKQAKEIKS